MARMILRELTFTEQMALGSLSQHPGFEVLIRIMDEACIQTAAEPIKLNPMEDRYVERLKDLTLIARATNDFCASVRNTCNTHINAAQHQVELQAQMDAEAEQVLETVRRASSMHVNKQ